VTGETASSEASLRVDDAHGVNARVPPRAAATSAGPDFGDHAIDLIDRLKEWSLALERRQIALDRREMELEVFARVVRQRMNDFASVVVSPETTKRAARSDSAVSGPPVRSATALPGRVASIPG
jgi:hypothetical protein